MNSNKVRYSCLVVCLSVLLGSSWSAPAAAEGILLKSEKFTLAPPEASTAIVPFQLGGPGKLILEITTPQQMGKLGIVVRGAYPKAVSRRTDGPSGRAPLRMEIQVTSQELQKGATWLAFPTLVGANKSLYPTPGAMVAGELKISFVPAPGSPQAGAAPPVTAAPQAAQAPQAAGSPAPKTPPPAQSATKPAGVGTAVSAGILGDKNWGDRQISQKQVATKVTAAPPPRSPAVATTAATLPNPSGFTATATTGGDVMLKWNPVPNATHYILQGPGVPPWSSSPNITGTTYTVKGLPSGMNSWGLWAAYKGPTGQPFWGDENNPAKASITGGWYKYSLTGFQVQSATTDDMLNRDGWGDEIYITMDVVETGPAGKVIQPSGRLPAVGNFGDIGKSENKIRAGTASNTGGLKTADQYFGAPFPFRVWCGQLVQGQTGVVVTSTVWEWDEVAGASFGDWMSFIKKHNQDLQADDVKKAGADFNANFGTYMQAGAVLTAAGAQGLLDLEGVLGKPGTRPIGMTAKGAFQPRAVILNYDIAEQALSRVWYGDPAGTLSINYQEPPGILNGEYTLKSRVERISGPQVCLQ
jgi:hypothetical protein